MDLRGWTAVDKTGTLLNVAAVLGETEVGKRRAWASVEADAPHFSSGRSFSTPRLETRAPAAATSDFPAVLSLSSLNGSNGFKLKGHDEFDQAGLSVSSAGDVNGDGFDDLLIGSPGRYVGTKQVGAAYVVFGSEDRFARSFDLSQVNGVNGFRVGGTETFLNVGTLVSSAGDINGDGLADVIISGGSVSSVTVIYGRATGFPATFDITAVGSGAGFRFVGRVSSASSAGDVNGDGIDDMIFGAATTTDEGTDPGAAYVVFGREGKMPDVIRASSLNGANGFIIPGTLEQERMGWSVAAAGDINRDGYADVIVGAPQAGANGLSGAGIAYVVFGKAGGFSAVFNPNALDGANGFRLLGANQLAFTGASVSSAGDVNGDGFDDMVVATNNRTNGVRSAFVVYGKAGGYAAAIDLGNLNAADGFRIDGVAGDSMLAVTGIGDFNGDGFDDFAVASQTSSLGANGAGSTYVIFGRAGGFGKSFSVLGLDGSNGFRLDGYIESAQSGKAVSSAGDFNHDGFADLLIGAGYSKSGGVDLVGENFVIFGHGPTGAVTRVGSSANQIIYGGNVNDALFGLDGDDLLRGGGGGDKLDGGMGSDWADYSTSRSRVIADLQNPGANAGEAKGDTYVSIENLRGTGSNDKLSGDAGANRLEGSGSADSLSGRDGNDALAGGSGKDTLTGGAGADRFEFASRVAVDADSVTDFISREDRIVLESDVFGLKVGALGRALFVDGTAAKDAGDRVIYDHTTGQLFFDPDGTGSEVQVLIATFAGNPAIVVGDILVA